MIMLKMKCEISVSCAHVGVLKKTSLLGYLYPFLYLRPSLQYCTNEKLVQPVATSVGRIVVITRTVIKCLF